MEKNQTQVKYVDPIPFGFVNLGLAAVCTFISIYLYKLDLEYYDTFSFRGYLENMFSDGSNIFMVVLIIFNLIVGIAQLNWYFKESKIVNEQLKEDQINRMKKKEEELALRFYHICEDHGFSEGINPSNANDIKIIASNCRVPVGQEDYYYNLGKDKLRQNKIDEEREAKERKLNIEIKKDKKEYDNIYELIGYIGKDKYLIAAKKEHNSLVMHKELVDNMKDMFLNNSISYSEKPSQLSSSIMGGIADGLAGPAAGMATYMNVERENAEARAAAEERTARVRKESEQQWKNSISLSRSYSSQIREIEKIIDRIEKKVCNVSNDQFNLLSIGNVSAVLKETNYFEINGEITLEKEIKLLNNPAILDGILCIEIYDNSSSNLVGKGYYCPPGENEVVDLSKAGFKKGHAHFSTLGKLIDGINVSDNTTYSCKVSPVRMWSIEI